MSRPFRQMSRAEFLQVLQSFRFRRRINAVHMHHTWLPRHSQYRGIGNIESMYRDHVTNRGFSDIAQHITIAPDGTIWTGRSWDQPPASARGHNGNSAAGPFMFEMIGNFDTGEDLFQGEQKRTALVVIANVQRAFGLPPESLRFHNQMSDKTCPGNSIDYQQFLQEVHAEHARLANAVGGRGARAEGEAPFPIEHAVEEEGGDYGEIHSRRSQERIREVLAQLSQGVARGEEDDAELSETDLTDAQRDLLSGADDFTDTHATRGAARGDKLTAEQKDRLRPHVIDLKQGRLVKGGDFYTLPGDVEAIFGEHLEQAIQKAPAGKPFPIVFLAHGGLVPEGAGLAKARRDIAWWLSNGIYPIYFVWETGFLQTIGQLLRGAQARGFTDVTDAILEKVARRLGGERIWAGMKANAEVAAQPGNGSDFTADLLKAFCVKHPNVELHAIGHSAGAIFHAHFLPTAFRKGVPAFKSAHFMAPAIRVDSFMSLLKPLIGAQIKHLTMFTMKTDFELDDNCAAIYRKSLLCLIHHALEPEDGAPLLGLEESLRGDKELVKLFGLGGNASTVAQVVFSKTLANTGPNASQSIHHGDFDDDSPTMNSVALRILGHTDNRDIKEFPQAKAAGLPFEDIWGPPDLSDLGLPFQPAAGFAAPPPAAFAPLLHTPVPASGGARRALCIGINAYNSQPLTGCVADARLWERTLRSLGFTATSLLDGEATYDNIRAGLRQLIRSSRPGDILVFQYSGHGTEAPDLDGDELSGPDQALCPVDFETGALLIDDDIAGILEDLPEGVNLTLFMDNCFSGDITRFALGRAARPAGPLAAARFLPMTEELAQAHAAFRQARGARALSRGPRQPLRGVLFAACRQDELAWEVNQQGEFTLRATRLLQSGPGSLTNQDFQQRLVEAFGANPRQHPTLRCEDRHLTEGLLAALEPAPARSLGRWAHGGE